MTRNGADAPALDEGLLGRLAHVVAQQMVAEIDVAQAEESLKEARERLRQVQEILLPELMAEAGVETFTTTSGIEVSVKPDLHANVSAERQPEAFAWLRAHGHGSLIKNDVVVTFGRGEEARARAVVDALRADGHVVARKEAVHPSTLKAFVREQLLQQAEPQEDGAPRPAFPLELFGVHETRKAMLKAPKKG